MIIQVRGLRRGFVVVLGALALGASGCGGDDAPTEEGPGIVADVAGLEGRERRDRLEEAAAKEPGALRLYTSLEEVIAKAVAARFERDTGIAVDLFRAKSEQVAERVAREAKAGVAGADVVETNGPQLVTLEGLGALADAQPPTAKLVGGVRHERWTTTRFNVFTVSRNTRRVKDAERPRTIADLADPRWKGRVAMEAEDYDWYLTLRDHWMREEGLSREEADGRFEAIARNARVVDGHSFMDELVAAGEFDIAASDYSYTVETTKADGAPVAWEPPAAPLIARANGVAVPRGADRPAKALLFTDWLLDEGQAVMRRMGMEVVKRDLVRDLGAEVLRVDDEDVVDREDEARTGYDRILKQAGKGPQEEG